MQKPAGKRTRRVLLLLLPGLGVLSLGLGGVFWAGSWLAKPALRAVGPPPDGLSAERVAFASESGATLHGWFIPGRAGAGGVVLFHPFRADRRSMLPRARFLNQSGYSVLLFDFQAHGESRGEQITFGYLESRDARAAVKFLRTRLPNAPIAAIGVSLGGAACLLGPEPLGVDAMVLEGVYPDIEAAVANRLRMRLGPLGPWLSPLLTRQLRWRLGAGADWFRPMDRIGAVQCPIMIVAGTDDRRTTMAEARQLFSAACGPKEFWAVEGAGHTDYHAHSKEEYETRVLAFLKRSLSRSSD